MTRNKFFTLSVGRVEIYQCVVHDKQALKTIAKKISNLRFFIKSGCHCIAHTQRKP